MSQIKVSLMGNPKILFDDNQVYLPFRKAEALLYYLLIKRQTTRDVVVDLLWGEVDEEIAKKNLRNAVYIIRKAFDYEVIVSPQRHILMIHPELSTVLDIDAFASLPNDSEDLRYEGDFLDGFTIKDAEYFEQWMTEMREFYRESFISKALSVIQKGWAALGDLDFERLCKQIIRADEYNEEAYRALMILYCDKGKIGRCTEIYQDLCKILQQDLAIKPDEKTTQLYEEMVNKRQGVASAVHPTLHEFFYGKETELKILKERLRAAEYMNTGPAILLMGEPGIGKSKLLEEALKLNQKLPLVVVRGVCYEAEETYPLKPWHQIFNTLSDIVCDHNVFLQDHLVKTVACVFPTFMPYCHIDQSNSITSLGVLQYQAAERAIAEILRKICEKIPLVICFEDIHWMDDMSLSLLKNVSYHCSPVHLTLLMTCRDEYRKSVSCLIHEMSSKEMLKRIHLNRLTEAETALFIKGFLPQLELEQAAMNQIYKETEGNPFFIVEYLNSINSGDQTGQMPGKIKDIIGHRVMQIGDDSRKVLNITAMFFDKIYFEDLIAISGFSEDTLSECLDELQERQLLKEVEEADNIWFCFTHQKLREYVYESITGLKKKILHNRIAQLLERKLDNLITDSLLYSHLIYHYECSGNKMAVLRYKIRALNEYVHISHELFPILNEDDLIDKRCYYLTKEKTLESMKNIEYLVEDIKSSHGWDRRELLALEVQFLFLEGRSLIRDGEAEKGSKAIRKMIHKAVEIEDWQAALNGYKNLVFCAINVGNTEGMYEWIQQARTIAEKHHLTEEQIGLKRLMGYYQILIGAFKQGELILNEVIEDIRTHYMRERLILIEAGALNYIGESKKRQGLYPEALDYFNQAIYLCRHNDLALNATLIYVNAMQTAYLLEDHTNALQYFEHAVKVYYQFDYPWGKVMAFGYAALLCLEAGRFEECIQHFKTAVEANNEKQSFIDEAIILRVNTQMALEAQVNPRAAMAFKPYLDHPLPYFIELGFKRTSHYDHHPEKHYFSKLLGLVEGMKVSSLTIL